MREFHHGTLFLAFLLFGTFAALAAAYAQRSTARSALNGFLAFALIASFGPGLTQRDYWPFSAWPLVAGVHPPYARLPRVVVLDKSGREYEVDARAWQPFSADELIAYVNGPMQRLSRPQQDEVAEYLVSLAERAMRRVRAGEDIDDFNNWFGPLTAPFFLLHPHTWSNAAALPPPDGLSGMRLYLESWNLDERRVNPSAMRRSLLYEYRRP